MTEKRFIAINDATTNDWELHDQLLKCTTLSTNAIGITKLLNELSEDNEQLKQSNQEAIELIHDGIVEMHDGKRDYAEKLLNEAIKLIK